MKQISITLLGMLFFLGNANLLFSQEKEEKEKARARLEMEQSIHNRSDTYDDTHSYSQGNDEDDFFGDLLLGLVTLPFTGSDYFSSGFMMSPSPLHNSGMGYGFGLYGSGINRFSGYFELKFVGWPGQPSPYYHYHESWNDETVESFQRSFCINLGLKKNFSEKLDGFMGLGWFNTSGYSEKYDDMDILGNDGSRHKYFVQDAAGDGNKLNLNYGIIFRPKSDWGVLISHDTALSATSFGLVFGR